MDKFLNIIDDIINKIKNEKNLYKDSYEFLKNVNLLKVPEYDNITILKIILVNTYTKDYDLINEVCEKIKHIINKITVDDFSQLFLFSGILLESNGDKTLLINDDSDVYSLYPNNIRSFIKKMFFRNNEFNKDGYNAFINFFDNEIRCEILYILNLFISTRDNDNTIFVNNENVMKGIKTDYKFNQVLDNNDVKDIINALFKDFRQLEKDVRDVEKLRVDKINDLNKLKYCIVNKEYIDLGFLNNINIPHLNTYAIIYNSLLDSEKYMELVNKTKDDYNDLDMLFNKYGFKINTTLIVNKDRLEDKLLLINNSLVEIKIYHNILLTFINDISYANLKKLVDIIDIKKIDYNFICNNIDYFKSDKEIDNFFSNVNLLSQYNINLVNVIKYDDSILFSDNLELVNLINKYKLYDLNFGSECYNYMFLKGDYTYMVDKFIEIGEYNLIKNNLGLINDDSNCIINRCLLYKLLGNDCLNEQGKLKGILRSENNFILSDKEVLNIVNDNYCELIPDNVLTILKQDEVDYIEVNLDMLKEYDMGVFYNINGMFISKIKLIKNMSKLLSSDLNLGYNELLFYSLIYDYPSLISLGMIDCLQNVFDIRSFKNK